MLPEAISRTSFQFPGVESVYYGKVRDVYKTSDNLLIMVASDRISAFDYILPKAIPFKGQVLNGIASSFMSATRHLVPNWIMDVPDPNVTIGKSCTPYRIEMVIRGYLTGHAWREYKSGKRVLCGVRMPDGMKENDRFPEPIITPATKADEGHDMDISREEILAQGIVPEAEYIQMEKYTRLLFDFGTEFAAGRGLILVDTKYEFGNFNGEVTLIDEIHTPDSSRYFYKEPYETNQAAGLPQKQLSKEFVRQWLIDHDFQGLDGQTMPVMPDEFVVEISNRYIELYEQITGTTFNRTAIPDRMKSLEGAVHASLLKLRS